MLNPRSQLPIYIDVDDVLSQTGQALCRCVQAEFGKVFAFEQIRHFDLSLSFSLTPAEFRHLFSVFHQSDYLLSLSPLADAAATVRAWYGSGRRIHIVTGRPASTRELTLEWLRQQDIPFQEFHIVDKYGRENDRRAVLSLEDLAAGSFAFAVEDSPLMAEFLTRRMKLPVYLMRRPWNETIQAGPDLFPVDGWAELRQICGLHCERSQARECSPPSAE